MLGIRRMTVILTLTALLFTAAGGIVLARQGDDDRGKAKVSEKFEDMDDYNWGLGDVVRLMVSGVFKGRSEGEFAPAAAITRQEMAVAAVRLIGREAEARALAEAEIEALLSQVDDAAQIAAWARASVALLIDLEAIDGNDPFRPAEEATRLDVAVLLVRALGYTAEAEAKMNAQLSFSDAEQIPAELVGYVAAAMDHGLIKGYENGTFRPDRAVKRVEMAVMMARADRQMEREETDEVEGIVTAVNAPEGTITLQVGGQTRTVHLAAEAAVFVEEAESDLAGIAVGMKAEIKLNADGLGVYVEAESEDQDDDAKLELRGVITGLIEAQGEALAVILVDDLPYTVAASAVIRLKGQILTFADLLVGDVVEIHVVSGLVTKIGVERESSSSSDGSTELEFWGTITGLTEATTSAAAQLVLDGTGYSVAADAEILLDGEAITFAELAVNDRVKVRVEGGVITRVKLESGVSDDDSGNSGSQKKSGTVEGTIGLLLGLQAGPLGESKIVVFTESEGEIYYDRFILLSGTEILLNGEAAAVTDLQVGDVVILTIVEGKVQKVEATR
ncbi:MAG: S-layer homology domain-containing protein [Bacillota bacterium]